MIPKPTEDTITVMLKGELERRGVKALAFPSLRTPRGVRKPDLYCQDGGNYVIEAKFPERKLIEAVSKIQNDYMKFYRLLAIRGGFALLYPDELAKRRPIEEVRELARRLRFKAVLMFAPEDRRNFHVIEGTLDELSDELARQILSPPEEVEPSVHYMIEVLREAAQTITSGLRHITGRRLEELFGGRGVFENILQYEEGRYPEEDLRLASAYLLVNQILFYHVLSRRRPQEFEEIDPDDLKRPADLNNYFSKVLDVNYRVVFSYDVASLIPSSFIDEVRSMVAAVQGLGAEKIGGDLLGTIFHDLIPFEVRKKVAAFYTNVYAAELLAWLSIEDPHAKVADLASGSGGLLVAAYRRKRYLLMEERRRMGYPEDQLFTAEDHRRFVEEELLGVDVMPFAANVAACHLALQAPEHFTDRVRIAVWDSTELEPGKVIPSIAHLNYVLKGQTSLEPFIEDAEVTKGAAELGSGLEEIKLEPQDVVIMNPPFTRQERIPEEYKRVLERRFGDYSDYLSGQMGYHGYFVLLADRFLKPGGRMALVLPATVLRVESMQGVRDLLIMRYHIEHIVTTLQRAAFSESAQFREILLVARKLAEGEIPGKTRFSILRRLPSNLAEARRFADAMRRGGELDSMVIRDVGVEELGSVRDNMFRLVALSDPWLYDLWKELRERGLLRFRDYLSKVGGKIIRGIELGGGEYSKLLILRGKVEKPSRDIWSLVEESGDVIVARHVPTGVKVEIPREAVLPALRRAAGISHVDVGQEVDYLVVKKWEGESFDLFKSLIGLKEGVLEELRRHAEGRRGNLVITRRMDLSAPGTRALAFYSSTQLVPVKLMWSVLLDDGRARSLAMWFNTSFHILQILIERVETRGAFVEISKYTLGDLLVPKPDGPLEATLLEVFEEISNVDNPSLLSQLKMGYEPRWKLDAAVLKSMGYGDGEIARMLRALHSKLAMEIGLLKDLMSGKTSGTRN